MDAHEGGVRRQPASSLGPLASDTGGVAMPVDSRVSRPDGRRRHGSPHPSRSRPRRRPSTSERPIIHSSWKPRKSGSDLTALEGRHHPAPAFVADLVVPPHHPRPVRQDVGFLGADAPFLETRRRSPVCGRPRARPVCSRPRWSPRPRDRATDAPRRPAQIVGWVKRWVHAGRALTAAEDIGPQGHPNGG